MNNVPGYSFGNSSLAHSPVSLQDLELLKTTLLFGESDAKALQKAGEVLVPQAEAILDVWYGFVGSNPHLVAYFAPAGGPPNMEYLGAVRKRFSKWIEDTCNRPYDQQWLDYQHEVALRHHSSKKNQTDGVQAVPIIHFRYLVAFIVPLTITIRPFLEKGNATPVEVEEMYNAWFKAMSLTALLWCQPYIQPNQF
jgi:Protoglobin